MTFSNSFTHLNRIIDGHHLRQKIKKISYRGDNQGCIVINTVGCYIMDLNIEYYLAYLLACDGYKVKILMDDFQMPHWDYLLRTKPESYKFHLSLKNKLLRGFYAFLSRKVFAHPNIETIWYSKILKEMSEEPVLTQKDKNHAESSTRKHFQAGRMTLEDEEHLKFYNACLINCRISKQVGMYVTKKLNPDLYITSHGFYSAFGSALDYIKEKNYHAVVFSLGPYHKQSLQVYENTIHYITRDKSWKSFNQVPLKESFRTIVDNYFKERMMGKSQDTSIYYNALETFQKKAFDKKKYKSVFALFPNVIWDGDVVERNTLFKGPVEWILTTIDFFKSHPEFCLVIRFHPGEAIVHTSSKPLEEIIREILPDLAAIENVKVISSHEKVNTYEFIKDNIDVGIVYDGMIGIESAYLNKPIILTAQSRMSESGIGFEPETIEAYLALLAQPEQLTTKFKLGSYRENVFKFTYWYLFERCCKLPIFGNKKYAYIDYHVEKEVIDPSLNPELIKTINLFGQPGQRAKSNLTDRFIDNTQSEKLI